MHMRATDGYSVTADEADAWLERLEQVALEVTGGRTPTYGGVPRAVLLALHAPDGRLLMGYVTWDDEARAWTVANDELGRFAWECSARLGRI